MKKFFSVLSFVHFSSFFKKVFSLFVTVTLLAPIFLPWQNVTFSAAIKDEHFLSVFLVEEAKYAFLSEKISRYAADVQLSTDNTKVLILSVPENATTEEVFRLLEKFYFEGQIRGEKQFFLNSVVLIGDIPLPQLSSEIGFIPSVLPYTDFKNPTFIWDSIEHFWVKNPKESFPEAEIFHGLIRGSIEEISDFFDKNHKTRVDLLEGKFLELVDDEIFYADFEKEQKSLMKPLLEQYETRQKISEELVNQRYNKNLLSAITGNFIKNPVFSSEFSEEERNLFPRGESVIYDNLEEMKEDFKKSSAGMADTKVKGALDDFIPEYIDAGSGFSRDVATLIRGTGRWDISSSRDTAESIALMDTFVANEVSFLNNISFGIAKETLEKMDSGVRLVDDYQEVLFGGGESMGAPAEDKNLRNGREVLTITNPLDCSLFRGADGYEDQYPLEKFKGDQESLFLPDALKGVSSQQVSFNLLDDVMSLKDVSASEIELYCEERGGCCALNFGKPGACLPDKAIHPIFSWNGDTISHESEERTSAIECQQFSFAGAVGVTEFAWGGYSGNYTGKKFIWGKLKDHSIREIPSIIAHQEPSFAEEKSLMHVSNNILAKHTPSNRVHYLDALIGDDGQENRVKYTSENLFRYKAKKPSISREVYPAQTQYELSRVVFENQMKLIGGNTVYNRKTQPSEFSGLAQQSAALRFQRIVHFTPNGMEVGHAYPVQDDFGKTGHDYEVEVYQNFLTIDSDAIFESLWGFVAEARLDNGPLNFTAGEIFSENWASSPFVVLFAELREIFHAEAVQFLSVIWETRAQEKLSTVLSDEAYLKLMYSRNNFVDVSRYYLHDYASDGFANLNPSLDRYLPDPGIILGENFSAELEHKYWEFTPLTLHSAPSWMTSDQQESLPEMKGKYFYEVFEVLAVGDDPLFSGIPAGGRSFTGARKNVNNFSSLYGAVTGLNIVPFQKEKKYVSLEAVGAAAFTKPVEEEPSLSEGELVSTEEEGEGVCSIENVPEGTVYPKISEDEFYKHNVVDKNFCTITQYFETYTLSRPNPPYIDIYSSITSHEDKSSGYNDFIFKWKDATADEKHKMLSNAFLNSSDNQLFSSDSPEKKGYAYMHLLLQGDDNIQWKTVPHNSAGLGTNNENNGGEEVEIGTPEEDIEVPEKRGEKDECGYYPEDSVPLTEWPSAVSCWLKNLKKVGFGKIQCGPDDKDNQEGSFGKKIVPLSTSSDRGNISSGGGFYSGAVTGTSEEIIQSSLNPYFLTIDANGGVFPLHVSKPIRFSFFRPDSSIALGERINFSITLKGAHFSENTFDKDENKEGIQQTTVLGKFLFEIIPDGTGEDVQILVDFVENDRTHHVEKIFSAVGDAGIILQENINNRIEKGETTLFSLSAQIMSEQGELDGYEGDLYVGTQNISIGQISQKKIKKNEEFFVAVRGYEKLEVTVTGDGLTRGKIVLQKEGGDEMLQKISEENGLQARKDLEDSIKKEEENSPLLTTFSRDDLKDFSLNTLYATVVGLESYRKEDETHLANLLLHSSEKLNAVTTHLVAPTQKKPKAVLFENGGMNVLDPSFEPLLISVEPIQFSFMKEDGVTPFAEVQLEDFEVEIENFAENSGLSVQKKPGKTSLFFRGLPLVDIYNSGSIIRHSNAFDLQRDAGFSQKETIFFFIKDGVALAKIHLKNGKWRDVTEEVVIAGELTEFEKEFIEAQEKSVRRNFSGKNLQIFDLSLDENIPLFPNIQNNLSKNIFGAGFKNREKSALLFAAGNSVGESTRSSADIFLVNFGDPFFSIPVPEKNDSGYDKTIGTELISRQEGDILTAFPLDIDGDGMKDIATVLSSGEILFSTRYKEKFRHWGSGVTVDPDFTFLGGYDSSGDGFDDIVYTDKKGKIFVWENKKGVFTLNKLSSVFPEISVMSGELSDIDNDGFIDFAVVTSLGDTQIFYGTEEKIFSQENSILINSVEFTLPKDLSSGLLLTFNGIKKLPNAEQFLFPIPYFSTQKNILESDLQAKKSQEIFDKNGYPENEAPSGGKDFQSEIDGMMEEVDTQKKSPFLPREKYFAPFSVFKNSFSVFSKKGEFVSPSEENQLGNRVSFEINITSADSDSITFTLADVYSPLLSLDRSSVQCIGCGDTFQGASYPNIAQAIVFENITLHPGQSLHITYEAEITNLPHLDLSLARINEDSIADIILTQKSGKNIERYVSKAPREYSFFESLEDEERELPEELQGNLIDVNANGVADKYEKDENVDGMPDFAETVLNQKKLDKNSNGIPDNQEKGSSLEEIGDSLDSVIQALASCNGGGCLSLPVNYASLVPGQMNLAMLEPLKIGIPSGPQPFVSTIYNYSPTGSWCVFQSCFQMTSSGPVPIPFAVGFAKSTFRFYLSPTLTGGLGVVVCTGPGGTTLAPTGVCFIQGISPDFLGDYCQDITANILESFSSVLGAKTGVFQVSSGDGERGKGGGRITFDLSAIDTSIPTARNTRLKSGPNVFADWANRQIEEIKGMFTTLPTITVYYPDISNTLKLSSWMDTEKASGALEDFEKNITKWDYEEDVSAKNAIKVKEDIKKDTAQSNENASISDTAREFIEDGYDMLKPAKEFLKNAEYKANSIKDLYRIIESVPLLRVQRKKVVFYIPSLTKREMIQKIAEYEQWITDAEIELERFKSDVASWPADIKRRGGAALGKAAEALRKMKKLKKALEFYLDEFPRLMEGFDTQLADYLYQVICYIDVIVDITGAWSRRNKLRLEKWEEFIATIPLIFDLFSTLPNVFNSYKSSCTTCHAGNYDSGTFELMIIGNIFPEIPVIRFPRLPDLTLDISQINAAITVEVPEIEFKERPIHLPNVFPPLLLPDVSPSRLQELRIPIPDIPDLPIIEFPVFPKLPGIKVPKLPDLPPAPELPDFIGDFATILKVIEKGLYLYCLIVRKGIFTHPELTSMSVVESLTARPLKPLFIDFLAIKLPEISFPSISEIEVTVEVNLETDFSIFTDTVEGFANKVNKKTYDFLDTDKYLPDDWDASLDFSENETIDDAFDSANDAIKNINKDIQKEVNDINQSVDEAENSLQDTIDNAVDSVSESLSSQQNFSKEFLLWRSLVRRNKKSVEKKWEQKSNKFASVSEIREKLGMKPFRFIHSDYTGTQYTPLKKKLLMWKKQSELRKDTFIDSGGEILALLKETSRDNIIYAQAPIRSEISGYKDVTIEAQSENVVPPHQVFERLKERNGEPQVTTPSGIFLSGRDRGVYKMMEYSLENDYTNTFFFLSQSGSDTESLVYVSPFSVFIKTQVSEGDEEKTTKNSVAKNPYTGTFEVGNFSDHLPQFQAPKNLEISGEGRKLSLTVFPEGKENVLGVVYIQDVSVFLEHRRYGENTSENPNQYETRKYIFRLEKNLFDSVLEKNPEISPDIFVPLPENFSLKDDSEMELRVGSEVMISRFDSLNTEIFVDEGKVYSIASHWVLTDGSLGNLSDHILASNLPSDDKSMPIVLDNFQKTAYLYRENIISLSQIIDLQGASVTISWDTNNDGVFETVGNSIRTNILREPTQEYIPIRISDSSGNTIDAVVTISYKAPSVFLSPDISAEEISGNISPRYSNVPVTLLRIRDGITKKIITDSVSKNPENSEFYSTDDNGNFSVQNFDLSPNVWIRDKSGKIVGEVIAKTGKLVSRDDAYTVDIISGSKDLRMRQVLLNLEKTIVGNVLIKTFSENSVQEISPEDSWNRDLKISGTYIKDANYQDDFVAGLVPFAAPENPGGYFIFEKESKNPLAFVYRDGNIRFFEHTNLKVQLHENHQNNLENSEKLEEDRNENKNLIVDILNGEEKIFEVMMVTAEDKFSQDLDKIDIDRSRTKGGKLAFLSFARDPLLSALDASVRLTLPFSDVDKNSEYYAPLSELFSRNLISGYNDGTFRPDEKISRAEFVQITLGVTDCLDCLAPSAHEKQKYYEVQSFPDVNPGDWFDFCIAKAKKLGMVQGYGDGFFKPENSITRAEAVAVLLRQVNIPLQKFPIKPMGDVPVDAWYYDAMATGLNLGLVKESFGYTFPREEITRGEFARMAAVLFTLRDCHELDSDGDGIPDYLEEYNGMNPYDSSDGKGINRIDLDDPRKIPLSQIPEVDTPDGPITSNPSDIVPEYTDDTSEDFVPTLFVPDIFVDPDFPDDLCPTLPEDYDGVLDEDGCPDYSDSDDGTQNGNASDAFESIVVIPGDSQICGFVNYRSQIRKNDIVWASILKDDDSETFSESGKRTIIERWK